MAVGLSKLEAQAVNAAKLTNELRYGQYAYYNGGSQPSLSAPNGYGDPTGIAGDLNRALFAGGLAATYHVKGTQTLLGPLLDTTGLGLDISQDQTDNDGVEYIFGANNTRGPFTYTVGTHNGFIKTKLRIADVSGTDDLCVGFRKQEAAQANVDDYDEAAFVNVILGVVNVETILNNAATVTTVATGATWADAAEKTIEVRLIGRRVTFYLDGSPLSGIPQFNFDSGEVVVPFLFFLQATTSPGKVFIQTLEVGQMKTVTAAGLSQ